MLICKLQGTTLPLLVHYELSKIFWIIQISANGINRAPSSTASHQSFYHTVDVCASLWETLSNWKTCASRSRLCWKSLPGTFNHSHVHVKIRWPFQSWPSAFITVINPVSIAFAPSKNGRSSQKCFRAPFPTSLLRQGCKSQFYRHSTELLINYDAHCQPVSRKLTLRTYCNQNLNGKSSLALYLQWQEPYLLFEPLFG